MRTRIGADRSRPAVSTGVIIIAVSPAVDGHSRKLMLLIVRVIGVGVGIVRPVASSTIEIPIVRISATLTAPSALIAHFGWLIRGIVDVGTPRTSTRGRRR